MSSNNSCSESSCVEEVSSIYTDISHDEQEGEEEERECSYGGEKEYYVSENSDVNESISAEDGIENANEEGQDTEEDYEYEYDFEQEETEDASSVVISGKEATKRQVKEGELSTEKGFSESEEFVKMSTSQATNESDDELENIPINSKLNEKKEEKGEGEEVQESQGDHMGGAYCEENEGPSSGNEEGEQEESVVLTPSLSISSFSSLGVDSDLSGADSSGTVLQNKFIKFWVGRLRGESSSSPRDDSKCDQFNSSKEKENSSKSAASMNGKGRTIGTARVAKGGGDNKKFVGKNKKNAAASSEEDMIVVSMNESVMERIKYTNTTKKIHREADQDMEHMQKNLAKEVAITNKNYQEKERIKSVDELVDGMIKKLSCRDAQRNGHCMHSRKDSHVAMAGDLEYDSITMFAEVLNNCPRPTEGKEEVWQQLLGMKRKGYMGAENGDTGEKGGGIPGTDTRAFKRSGDTASPTTAISYLEAKDVLERSKHLASKANSFGGSAATSNNSTKSTKTTVSKATGGQKKKKKQREGVRKETKPITSGVNKQRSVNVFR
eukprot:Nk52_evm78s2118 gene=Nk52_evmTU78s2118